MGTLKLDAVAWNAPSTGSITSISNAAPRVATVASHTLTTGQLISITGNSVAANNATWRVGTTTATTFQLLNLNGSNSTAPGSVGNGGAWQRADQLTTRVSEPVLQDQVYVKAGATSRRYVGTIRMGWLAGQCDDTAARRLVSNYQNAVPRKLKVIETTNTWAVASNFAPMANNLANRLEIVTSKRPTWLRLHAQAVAAAAYDAPVSTWSYVSLGVALDTIATGTNHADVWTGMNGTVYCTALYANTFNDGYHYLQLMNYSLGSVLASTFYGDNNSLYVQSGAVGEIWA